jgi:cyclopropane-fatty-acyl-phospholipid synthase
MPVVPKSVKVQDLKHGRFPTSVHIKCSRIDRWLLHRIHKSVGRPPIRLKLGNGVEVSSPEAVPGAAIVIRDRRTLLGLILDPEVGFGNAYGEGRITVQGDLVAALEAVYRSTSQRDAHNWYTRIVSRCLEYVQRNSLRGTRQNIHRHYDLNNDFYRLWLDPQLVYSCAYFPSAALSLEDAQAAKMDYICRKLSLQPGERVVDVGCGWGALALYMAKHYGVKVRGFSISREQVHYARRKKWISATVWNSSKMIIGTFPESVTLSCP